MVPNPARPGSLMPVSAAYRRPCGLRYQEGAAGLGRVCECGTFAIGLCADCGKPVCGDHSVLHGGKRLCHADLRAREKAAAVAEAEARLTPAKFIVIAAAAGNPGLRTWTVNRKETRTITVKEGSRFRKPKTEKREVYVELYEIRGWAFAHTDRDGGIHGAESLMITDTGKINYIESAPRGRYGDGYIWWGEGRIVLEADIEFDYGEAGWEAHQKRAIHPHPGYLEGVTVRSLGSLCERLGLRA